jgi:predicted exporter
MPWVVLLATALIAIPFIPFEPHPWNLAVRGNPKSAEMERLNSELGSSFTPLAMISRGATRDEALARDRKATRALQNVALRAGISYIESPTRWLPAPEDQLANIAFIRANRELFSSARFSRDFDEIVSGLDHPDPYLTDDYLPLVARFLQNDPQQVTLEKLRSWGLGPQIDGHLLELGDEHIVISRIFMRRFPWAEGAVDSFLEMVDRLSADELADVRIVGDALRSSGHARTLRRDAFLATALALTLVIGVLLVQFRDIASAGLALLPLVCGLSAVLAAMALMGIELNMLTLAAAPIIVGIGVDDGIHMVDCYRTGRLPARLAALDTPCPPAQGLRGASTQAGTPALWRFTSRGSSYGPPSSPTEPRP